VVPRPGVRVAVPAYVPQTVVYRPSPTVVATSAEELAVVPVKEVVEEAEAYRVIDVDAAYTVTVQIDGRPTPVRMLGVEPPLVAASDEDETGTLPEAALHFVRNLLVAEFVYLDHDPGLEKTDADGNLVAYLYRAPDELLVNLELIRQGYALAAEGYSYQLQEAFTAYQAKAQADQKGIWASVAVAPE
jgi:endonuclease YncB( thermonuclease family)